MELKEFKWKVLKTKLKIKFFKGKTKELDKEMVVVELKGFEMKVFWTYTVHPRTHWVIVFANSKPAKIGSFSKKIFQHVTLVSFMQIRLKNLFLQLNIFTSVGQFIRPK